MSAFRLRCLFDCLFPSAGEECCMQSGACECELARYGLPDFITKWTLS